MRQRQKLWIAVCVLWLLFAQTLISSRRLSLTYDEPLYTAIGYADLTTADVRWHEVIGHPPLVNLLTTWPLLLGAHHPDVRQSPAWGTEDSLGFSRFVMARLGALEHIALVTRLPVMWLMVLFAAFVYRWAQRIWGGWAGLLALTLFAFDPHILAHGQLNTTDLGVTAFGFIGCYALACYLKSPSWRTYLGAGLAIGAALASKASGPFWLGAFGLTVLLAWLQEPPDLRWHRFSYWAGVFIGWLGLALFVLWAAYLFELRTMVPNGPRIPAASHWAGLAYIRTYMATGQTTFLAGKLLSGGHWSYFPLALLLKTPIPILIALPAALLWFLRQKPRLDGDVLYLLVVPVAYLVFAMGMSLNIGHRHMLPLYPFAAVFIAQFAGKGGLLSHQPVVKWEVLFSGGLVVWYILGTVTLSPHYLTYFNELAGGPDGGYRYLADSSVDWGQSFYELRDYLESRPIENVHLAAFSSLDPAWYGLDFTPLPPTPGEDVPLWLPQRFDPTPGRYVLSVTPLQGMWILDPDTYDWFRHQQPTDRVGYNFFIYDVMEKTDDRWVIQCAISQPLLNTTEIVAGFGRHDLRMATFNCETSWLYPAGVTGWTVLPEDYYFIDWVSARLIQQRLSFRQSEFWNHPALVIYEQREIPIGSIPSQTQVLVAPTAWQLDKALIEGFVTSAPVSMAGPLTFLGYDVKTSADGIELHTYWHVDEFSNRPLSLMAHLVDFTGQSVAVADGLGVPIESWYPGDIIVQRHHFLIQEQIGGTYWLQTGAYWLDTMERWLITTSKESVGDRILLIEISR